MSYPMFLCDCGHINASDLARWAEFHPTEIWSEHCQGCGATYTFVMVGRPERLNQDDIALAEQRSQKSET